MNYATGEIEEIFKYLHSHPELSYREENTTAYIKDIMLKEGIKVLDMPFKTGLVVEINGDSVRDSSITVAMRADIDALPVEEQTGLTYMSQNKGVMHACGHDIHTSVAIETARLLNHNRERLAGNVRILFQPAEESGFGVKEVLEADALGDAKAVFSLHSSPLLLAGELGIKAGAITSSVDIFRIKINGMGTHAAMPQNGIDPIVAASAIVTSIQSIVSRSISPYDKAVVSVTHIEGGKSWNVIPDTVFLEGTVRTMGNEVRDKVVKRMYEVVESTAAAYGVKADIEWRQGPPATNNDPGLAEYAWDEAMKSGLKPVDGYETMVGEDFAFIQEKYRGLMIWVGTGKGAHLHNPEFKADYGVIRPTAEYFTALITGYIQSVK